MSLSQEPAHFCAICFMHGLHVPGSRLRALCARGALFQAFPDDPEESRFHRERERRVFQKGKRSGGVRTVVLCSPSLKSHSSRSHGRLILGRTIVRNAIASSVFSCRRRKTFKFSVKFTKRDPREITHIPQVMSTLPGGDTAFTPERVGAFRHPFAKGAKEGAGLRIAKLGGNIAYRLRRVEQHIDRKITA